MSRKKWQEMASWGSASLPGLLVNITVSYEEAIASLPLLWVSPVRLNRMFIMRGWSRQSTVVSDCYSTHLCSPTNGVERRRKRGFIPNRTTHLATQWRRLYSHHASVSLRKGHGLSTDTREHRDLLRKQQQRSKQNSLPIHVAGRPSCWTVCIDVQEHASCPPARNRPCAMF